MSPVQPFFGPETPNILLPDVNKKKLFINHALPNLTGGLYNQTACGRNLHRIVVSKRVCQCQRRVQ
jgi:hypothetical protein